MTLPSRQRRRSVLLGLLCAIAGLGEAVSNDADVSVDGMIFANGGFSLKRRAVRASDTIAVPDVASVSYLHVQDNGSVSKNKVVFEGTPPDEGQVILIQNSDDDALSGDLDAPPHSVLLFVYTEPAGWTAVVTNLQTYQRELKPSLRPEVVKADVSNKGQLALYGNGGELVGNDELTFNASTGTISVGSIRAERFVSHSLDFLGGTIANAALVNTTLDDIKHLTVTSLGIASERNEEVGSGVRMAAIDAQGGVTSTNLARWDDEKQELKVPAITSFSTSGLEVRSDLDLTSHTLRNFGVEANTTLEKLRFVDGIIQDTLLSNVTATDLKLGSVEMETLSLSSLAKFSSKGMFLGVGDEGELVVNDAVSDSEGVLAVQRDVQLLGSVDIKGSLDVQGETYIHGGLTVTGSVLGSGPYVDMSDIRLKKNIESIGTEDVLESITQLKAVSYELDLPEHLRGQSDYKQRQVGFIAQDVEQVFPLLVDTDSAGFKGVQYSRVVPLLVEGLKELRSEVRRLEMANNILRKDFDSLVNRLEGRQQL